MCFLMLNVLQKRIVNFMIIDSVAVCRDTTSIELSTNSCNKPELYDCSDEYTYFCFMYFFNVRFVEAVKKKYNYIVGR